MHGRKKSTQPPSQREIDAIKKKISTYQTLVGMAFEKRRTGDRSMETLDLTGKLLASFPDFYSMWNYRREILIDMHSAALGPALSVSGTKGEGREGEERLDKISEAVGGAVRDMELALSAECIQKNPKSYCAWHHRKWVLERFQVDYAAEFSLCRDFLKLDQRNFHCWNYRRFVAQIGQTSPEEEFGFSEEKIHENFSNYSAFHHRSVYIFTMSSELSMEQILEREFEIVMSAIYTEPDDQSAWWYHQFLLSNIYRSEDVAFGNNLLQSQVSMVEELLQVEPDCKLAKVALTHIMELFIRRSEEGCEVAASYRDRRREALELLCETDKMHVNRYRYLLSLKV